MSDIFRAILTTTIALAFAGHVGAAAENDPEAAAKQANAPQPATIAGADKSTVGGSQEMPRELAAALEWLPPDTETIAASRDFTLENPIKTEADYGDGWPLVKHMLRGLTVGPLRQADYLAPPWQLKERFSQLRGRRVKLAVFGGRMFKPASAFGGYIYDGGHVLMLNEDLPDRGVPFTNSLRKSAVEVRKVAGHEIFVFDLETQWRGTSSRRWPMRGTFVTLLKPNVVWAATNDVYLEEMLARFHKPRSPRALPADLPEWKHVDVTAEWWLVRHIGKGAAVAGETQVAVGSAITLKPHGRNELQAVYISLAGATEEYVRWMWYRRPHSPHVTIRSVGNQIVVSIPFDKKPSAPLFEWVGENYRLMQVPAKN